MRSRWSDVATLKNILEDQRNEHVTEKCPMSDRSVWFHDHILGIFLSKVIYCKRITFGDVFFLVPLAVDIHPPNQDIAKCTFIKLGLN